MEVRAPKYNNRKLWVLVEDTELDTAQRLVLTDDAGKKHVAVHDYYEAGKNSRLSTHLFDGLTTASPIIHGAFQVRDYEWRDFPSLELYPK